MTDGRRHSQHLRFFFEYGVDTPLWPGATGEPDLDSPFGHPCELELLPITPDTRAELARLAEWYQDSFDPEYPPAPSPWSTEEKGEFARRSAGALAALRAELGAGWTVEDRSRPIE